MENKIKQYQADDDTSYRTKKLITEKKQKKTKSHHKHHKKKQTQKKKHEYTKIIKNKNDNKTLKLYTTQLKIYLSFTQQLIKLTIIFGIPFLCLYTVFDKYPQQFHKCDTHEHLSHSF